MRVALVTHRIESGQPGGAGRSLLALVEHARDVEFVAFVPKADAMAGQLADRGVEVEVVPFRNCFVHGRSPLRSAIRSARSLAVNRRAVREIVRGLRSRRVDLVHSNSLMTDVGYEAARHARIPHLWHIREIISDQHGRPVLGQSRLRAKVRRSEGCVAVSETAADALWTRGVAQSRLREVVYNGVFSREEIRRIDTALDRVDPSIATGLKVCIIGGVQPAKGQDIAIAAVARLRQSGVPAELNIAGGGNLEWARSVCETEDVVDSVRFLGRVDGPWDVLGSSHICLICSEAEAMGRVAAEALASGTPIVATRGGATDELLGGGLRGALVNREPEAVAGAIAEVWNEYPAADAKAQAAMPWAREVFSVEAYARRMCQVYAQLTALDLMDGTRGTTSNGE